MRDTPSARRCSPGSRRPRSPAMVMPSISTKGSPSMIMRSEKVPESPSSALHTTYFWSAGRVQHRLPLDAGREGRAAAPAQSGLRSPPRRSSAPLQCQRIAQTAPAAMRFVVGEAERIGDADAREGQALLRLAGTGFLRSDPGTAGAAPPLQEAGVEQAGDVLGCDRAVGDAAAGVSTSTIGSSQNSPREPLRTRRTSSPRRAASRTMACATASAPSESADGVARNVDRDCSCCFPRSRAISCRKRSGVTRPCNCPSIITAGEQAQLPRQ